MRTAGRAGLAAVLIVAGAAVSSCNVDRLLQTKDKDTSTPGSINSAAGLPNARAGAISQFQVAFGGSAAGGGSANEGQINMTALLTDEYVDLETFPTRISVDNRIAEAGNGTLRGDYLDLSQARVSAERAVALYQRFDSTNVLQAEMLNLAGYSYVLFAEDFCSGVPFDLINANGTVVNGQPLTTDSIYGRALADFTAASVIATADSIASDAAGALDPKAVEQLSVARVGRARVLLDRAQYAPAQAVADSVPTSFVYAIEGSTNTPRENNGVWYFTTQLAFSVADLEGGNGLDFLSAGDPRVTAVDAGTPGFSGIGPDFQIEQKYTSPTDPIPLATGLETRLIAAEAKLKAGQIAGWRASLDSARADSGLAALPADSTTTAAPALRVNVMFRERAFWLYLTAHRLSDMRRLIRQYGRDPETVFPTGIDAITGAPYGTSIEFPVSSDEFNNPNFHGCLNNNA